ncbi:MAG: NAD(P)H-hydrate dehydratase, partial [Lautropia sp.]
GLSRPLAPMLAERAGALARQRGPVVAFDVPCGLAADRGAAVGDGAVISAVATVTMLGDKPGLHTGAGLRHAGVVRVAPLREVDPATGTDPAALPDTVRPEATRSDTAQPAAARSEVTRLDAARPDAVLLTPERIAALLPPRRADAHKGDAGDVLVLGGRLGMAGAARLAARGALAAGAGRIWIATEAATGAATGAAANAADRQTPIDPLRPELMRWRFDRRDTGRWPGRAPVLVIGCGLGHDPTALAWLTAACGSEALLVCDADALNLLAGRPALTRDRAGATIVTPHPLEAARLLATSTAAIEHDRIGGAIAIARRYRAVAVLKGAGTVVADPAGHYAINTSGNPLLATGGTGDLLAGIIGALAAAASRRQALAAAAAAAACAGVWLHGAAADRLAARHGSTGIPAGRIAAAVPATLRALQAGALRG